MNRAKGEKKMKVFDVVKYEGENNVLVWKFPGEDFNTLSQLVVHETQEAVFFKDGQALDLFKAGRYTLHSQNIPLIRRLVNLPFNGESPFHCEVFFVNKVVSMDIKWGTINPISIQDPIYKIILPISVSGQFAIQVEDSKRFLLSLVGTISQFDQNTLTKYFQGILMMNIKDYIVKQFTNYNLSFLEIQGNLKKISDGIALEVAQEFERYGLRLVNFNVTDIAPSESDSSYIRLKQALEKKAEMQVIGYNYQQERTYDILDTAAANEGTSSDMMGAGMGLGMGLNIGNTLGGMMGSVTPDVQQTTQNGMENTEMNICPKCKNVLPAGAQFCSACGTKIEVQEEETMVCPHCHEKVPKGKFCMACGKSMELVCPQCGQPQKMEAKFCMFCGARLDEEV